MQFLFQSMPLILYVADKKTTYFISHPRGRNLELVEGDVEGEDLTGARTDYNVKNSA